MLTQPNRRIAVLFVCLGNICRSPLAEGAFRRAAEKAGLDCEIASAGTASYHIGEAPDARAITVARANGVDIGQYQGRQLCVSDFETYSHIFALDTANLAGINAVRPRASSAEVALLMDAVPGRKGEPVKDPYHGDEGDFETVWQDMEIAADALIARFEDEGVEARF